MGFGIVHLELRMAEADCRKCGAKCCKYYALEIDEPDTRKEFDDIRWYVAHEKTSVFVEDGKWYLHVFARCNYLDKDNRCRIYEKRPRICRKYNMTECEFEGWEPELLFRKPEEVEAYFAEHFGKGLAKVDKPAKKRGKTKSKAGKKKRAKKK